MNTVWDNRRSQWANVVFRRVRALGVLGAARHDHPSRRLITSYHRRAQGATARGSPNLAGWAVAFVLNIVLFVVS